MLLYTCYSLAETLNIVPFQFTVIWVTEQEDIERTVPAPVLDKLNSIRVFS